MVFVAACVFPTGERFGRPPAVRGAETDMTAEVIVDIASSETDRIFEYRSIEGVREGSRVKVPFGPKQIDGYVMKLKDTPSIDPAALKEIIRVIDDPLTPECMALADAICARYRCPKALSLRLFLPSEMRRGAVRRQYRSVAVLADPAAEVPERARMQTACLRYLKEKERESVSVLSEKYGRSAVNALADKGIVRIEREQVSRTPYPTMPSEAGEERVLTAAQEAAIAGITGTDRTVSLLHGVTGSGKTEVYLQLIARALEKGQTAIFLVPEISLTPQMFSQLRARFGDRAAILHSGLSAGEKFDEWERLRGGEAAIAVGARSAVFAPLENIGIIILDEEHDSSYTSDQTPRYSALEIARMRAEYNHCRLVLGSATPSVETYLKAREGEYFLAELPERINRRPLPEMVIADMRREVRRGNNSAFSSVLRDSLEKTLEDGNQAILFLNRRGYASSVICRECGYVAKCEHCDVSLTYHSEEKCLKCHTCGASYRMLRTCPECGGVHLTYSGTGTQRVEEDLKKILPGARVLRMDFDTVSGKEGHYRILRKFASKEADILIGTQMIAKGHDFPSVTLVGILDADMSLHFSDYRSGERTFQLITQVSGRSGRAEEKGIVVVQTYDPGNSILRYAVRYDYRGFFEHEMSVRKVTSFPPFAKIVRVMVTATAEQSALDVLKEVFLSLKELVEQNREEFLFFNRMHSPVRRVQKRFRYQVLMRIVSDRLLPEIYSRALACRTRDTLVYVEENPVSLS